MNHVLNSMFAIATTGILVTALILFKGRQRMVRGAHLPPGPVPLPLVGNILSIGAKEPWKTYSAWATHYGDIFMIRVLKQNIIVIHSEEIARDLLERRSNIYSSRPYLASKEPFGWSFNFGWAPYGDHWRLQRRTFHQAFRAKASVAYHPVQLRKARQFILDILSAPHDFYAHIHRYSAALIMSIVYDYNVAPGHDRIVEMLEHGNELAMESLTPEMSSIIDAFPFVLNLPTWLPGAVISRKAAVCKAYVAQMISEPFKHAAKREAEGSGGSAMALDLLKRFKDIDDPVRFELLKDTCATAYVAGAETTTTMLRWFMLAMLQHPEVQERAQAEIEAVVGTNRLPDFDDRPNLPYVEAILMEIFRMYAAGPLGIPHSTTADDIYGDLFIPKGSTVVANIWAMCHNEDVFQKPNVFIPERFLKDGKYAGDRVVDSIAFGFGRRVCPGRHVADNSVWAAMVLTLSVFKISRVLDEQGEELCFDPGFSTGVTVQPNPFPCTITPRMSDSDIRKLLTVDF